MLELQGATVRYGEGAPALDGLDLTAEAGSITAVVGGNGAGKTTLMRTLSGVLGHHRGRLVGGEVTFEGRSLAGVRAEAIVRRGIAHIPEGRRVFTDLTVEENLVAGAATRRGRSDGQISRIYDMFPVLAERRRQRAVLLSGGEQQMLAIGRGLMSEPILLLLDEPTLGLAPKIVAQIGEIVQHIREAGTSVLLVEQNAAMALAIADQGFVLGQGRVVLGGSAAALRATNEVQQMYLGGSAGDDEQRLDRHDGVLERWSA
ncbi:ABC transporter ATP-binding protein [Nocardioides limicola]|uniref:ABC transporter ATP-binding protein n=1 Tax=Nocardioides limicola TaxID=2803368 RepID=UPI00193B9C3D|nr:ABC transporter ATP-binding protein [Nocardioides sp. DJM-14]